MKDLKSLFESSMLNDETKAVLKEAWDASIAHKEAKLEVAYASKLEESTSAIQDNIFSMIEEAVADELAAVADELTEARNLEVKYANKLEDFKTQYDVKIQEQVQELVDTAVKTELDEMKEEIAIAKKHQFALDMFESYKTMFDQTFGGENLEAQAELTEARQELATLKRQNKLNELLESISGSKRQVALTILEGVSTEKLEEHFDNIRPILLAEAEESKEEPVTEGEEKPEGNVVLEGEEASTEVVEEPVNESKVDAATLARLNRSLQFARSR